MTSREIIRRVLHHDAPPRFGWDFADDIHSDFCHTECVRFLPVHGDAYTDWCEDEELQRLAGFRGEVRYDVLGNIYGRFLGKTKGECRRGVLEDDWEKLADYRFPQIDHSFQPAPQTSDKYRLTYFPFGVFSSLRDMRLMSNALMDTVLEPEMVTEFLKRLCDLLTEAIRLSAQNGADGLILGDDWGTQTASLISPASFASLFKPAYARIADACHENGMDFILHSCGKVQALVDDMIDAGIDAFQFDQPELSGVEFWAKNYGQKTVLYSPVDIQKILPTGDRAFIEDGARRMVNAFRAVGGSLIAKDYGNRSSWADIDVKPEWVAWARDIILQNSEL